MLGERRRTIKLFCPSLSKRVPLVAWDEQRLDLGAIAGVFGLEQATLKLNGHFIGRGVDLIASSVTWKSLLSFFSSRGLPAGETDADAIVVGGKLSRVGTKRAHDPADVENGIHYAYEHPSSSINTMPQLEDANFIKNKRRKERSPGYIDRSNKVTECGGLGPKRKQCSEDVSIPLKRIRMTGNNSVMF